MYEEGPSEEHLMKSDASSVGESDSNDNVRKKSTAQNLLSQFRNLKNFSLERSSTNSITSGTITDSTNSVGDTETINYLSIENEENSVPDNTISNESDDEYGSFIYFLLSSKGPFQIMVLSLLFAIAVGSTVGVVPVILTQRFAEFHHGFDGICSDYDKGYKPQACLEGSSDAQSAASAASFVTNLIIFMTSSLVGALSDEYGRRNLLVIAQLLSCSSPLVYNNIDPRWYYVADSTGGIISWISIALSSLSDETPKQWRAPMFGFVLASFSLGFAFSPIIALFCSHFISSLLSVSLLMLGFIYSLIFLPETLPLEQAVEARLRRTEFMMASENQSRLNLIAKVSYRPFKELSILNRNTIFRLLSLLAFFSGMSLSADQTLLLYYADDRLGFNASDVAILFGIMGVAGIFVQSIILKQITGMIGERLVVVVAFFCGAITNTMYAFANKKTIIFIAVLISSFTGMSFPTISALKSNNADESEQGRIQGALYALSSLARAIGPPVLSSTYQVTKKTSLPGSFFLVGTLFYIIAVLCAYRLPKDKADAIHRNGEHIYNEVDTNDNEVDTNDSL